MKKFRQRLDLLCERVRVMILGLIGIATAERVASR